MRLIDADALIEKYGDWYTEEGTEEGYIGEIKGIVNSMPTIEERKAGKWQWLSSTYDRNPCEMRYMCSVCHHEVITHIISPWENYCPNCGASMMEGEQP